MENNVTSRVRMHRAQPSRIYAYQKLPPLSAFISQHDSGFCKNTVLLNEKDKKLS